MNPRTTEEQILSLPPLTWLGYPRIRSSMHEEIFDFRLPVGRRPTRPEARSADSRMTPQGSSKLESRYLILVLAGFFKCTSTILHVLNHFNLGFSLFYLTGPLPHHCKHSSDQQSPHQHDKLEPRSEPPRSKLRGTQIKINPSSSSFFSHLSGSSGYSSSFRPVVESFSVFPLFHSSG